MKKEILTEQQVKEALGINSFRELSKDKVCDFISMIPNMDSEVAKAAILQFPEYVTMSTNIVSQLTDMCDKAISSADKSQIESINAYKMLLGEFSKILADGEITPEERKYYTNLMVDVADKIAEKDTEQKEFLNGIVKGVTYVGVAALAIGATILGVKTVKKK